MGNLQSMICVNRKNLGVEKTIKEEIEETPVVEIHLNCPSNTGSSHSQRELRKDIDTAEAVESCSVETIEIKSYSCTDDEWSSDSLSSQSEDECDTTSDAHEHQEESCTMEVRGKKCFPRHMEITGLGQETDYMDSYTIAPVESHTNWRNERYSVQGKNSNDGYSFMAREYLASSAPRRARQISFPAPRPSQWQWMYSKILKPREQLANESLKIKQLRKEYVHREDGAGARSGRPMEKIRKTVRPNATEDSNSGPSGRGSLSPRSSSADSVTHKLHQQKEMTTRPGDLASFFEGEVTKSLQSKEMTKTVCSGAMQLRVIGGVRAEAIEKQAQNIRISHYTQNTVSRHLVTHCTVRQIKRLMNFLMRWFYYVFNIVQNIRFKTLCV